MTNFNERRNTLLYKNISHTLFSNGLMFLLCVRDERRQGQTTILTQVLLLTIAALLPHLGLGCSTGGRWGPWPSICELVLTRAFLSPTKSTAAGTCFIFFHNAHFLPLLIYAGASLIDSSVKDQYITLAHV